VPLRVVELFRVNSFRMAVRPGLIGLDWPEGFVALEQYLAGIATELAAMPYERFVTPRQEDFPERPGPRYDGLEGWVDLVLKPSVPDDAVRVFLRASMPFRSWRLGCWVVWDGFRASPNGARTPLTTGELGEAW
jgi:hypothetical protein